MCVSDHICLILSFTYVSSTFAPNHQMNKHQWKKVKSVVTKIKFNIFIVTYLDDWAYSSFSEQTTYWILNVGVY